MGGALTLVWPGGEHGFRLTLGHLRALQELCDAGPFQIRVRLMSQTARVNDVTETLRLGLMGGGMGEGEARRLVHTVAESSGLMAMILPALSVLTHALVGPVDDPAGDGPAESDGGKPTGVPLPPTASGDSPASTETAP